MTSQNIRTLILMLFSLLTIHAMGQKAMTFDEALSRGLDFGELDKSYRNAVNSDPALAVFGEDQDAFMIAYQNFLQELGSFLKSNGFEWSKNTRSFNRIYFTPDGTIDYFLFNFRRGEISEDEEQEFKKLTEEFVADYTFGLTASSKFSQCSPVVYTPAE